MNRFTVDPIRHERLATRIATSLVSTLLPAFACPLPVGTRFISQSLIDFPKSLQMSLIHLLQVEHAVACAFRDSYQFVQLELQRLSVSVLCILNKKYH